MIRKIPPEFRIRTGASSDSDEAPPPPPVNANVVRIFLSFDGGVVMLFDRPVIVDEINPPTTWSFHGTTWIQAGGFHSSLADIAFFYLNGPVNPGDPVVIAADDPAARTPDGGYVNGGMFTVDDI